ncbi:MAG: Inward rectifier potassium channel Irk [Chitinophagia bacterium]|nr:Inward rectifier potassium channel Irk [Chitinophagia bacterium]
MSHRHFHKHKLKELYNTGFERNSTTQSGRLINNNGTANLKKTGVPVWQSISIYHTLLRMNRIMFFLSIFIVYSIVNFVFALIYTFIGVEHLTGSDMGQTFFWRFTKAFFFSCQTLTTVGYGHVAPTGLLANFVASIESLLGILVFAIVTGLIYGRFSRPRAYLMFSDNMLIAPHKHGKALMLRMATYKNNHITDVEAQLTLAVHTEEHGKNVTRYYPLPLEIPKISSLALSWTIVHPINEDSPLYQYDKDQINHAKLEVIVVIKGFDDHFSNIVQQRTSYTHKQIVYGAKYLPMFERSADGNYTIVELDKINAHEPANLPEEVVVAES